MLFCVHSLLADYNLGSKLFAVEFSRDKLSCRILRLQHSHSHVVKNSEIKVEKRVNLTYLVFLSLVVE